MWLFTKHGMVSIVRDRDDPDVYHARARKKAHLTALIRAAKEFEVAEHMFPGEYGKVKRTPGRDYKFRARIDFLALDYLVMAAAKGVTYPNFKDAAHDTLPQDYGYHDWLLRVWNGGWEMQEPPRGRRASYTTFDDFDLLDGFNWKPTPLMKGADRGFGKV